jgi:hypothetical protein
MSAVDEALVREYFELHGFLILQRRKYIVQARQKTAEEEIDLLVLNPRTETASDTVPFELDSASLGKVGRALVSVKGWHTEIFAPSVLAHAPKIFRFVEKTAVAEAEKLLGAGKVQKILVIPGLPRGAAMRKRSIEMLRERGVDAVLSFPTILRDLLDSVKTNRQYTKSDILQLLRLLKHYGLIKEPQLELKLRPRKSKFTPTKSGSKHA